MRKYLFSLTVFILALALVACGLAPATPGPTNTPPPKPTATAAAVATAVPTANATAQPDTAFPVEELDAFMDCIGWTLSISETAEFHANETDAKTVDFFGLMMYDVLNLGYYDEAAVSGLPEANSADGVVTQAQLESLGQLYAVGTGYAAAMKESGFWSFSDGGMYFQRSDEGDVRNTMRIESAAKTDKGWELLTVRVLISFSEDTTEDIAPYTIILEEDAKAYFGYRLISCEPTMP